MTGVMVLKQFFGLKPGQTLKEFSDELKALSPDSRAWLEQEAAKQLGVQITTLP